MIILILLFILSIILETSVVTIPLSLILLLNFAIATKKTSVFFAGFVCGLILDILLLNPLGQTSLFFVVFLSFIFLYERKFDIQTFPFVIVSSFLGSLSYLILIDARFILVQALVSALLSTAFFWGIIQADSLHLRGKKMLYEK